MCGGPTGNHTRITDVSGSADWLVPARKRNGSKPAAPTAPNDSAPIFKKPRRVSGPGQRRPGGMQNNSGRRANQAGGQGDRFSLHTESSGVNSAAGPDRPTSQLRPQPETELFRTGPPGPEMPAGRI